MSKKTINLDGQDVVVREDTAKAFRWLRFETILLTGIILLFIAGILFFSGVFALVGSDLKQSNAPPAHTQPGP